MPNNADNFQKEVEGQLDDLLSDQMPSEDEQRPEDAAVPGPLRELKAVFLAVDWEISDEVMAALLTQISALTETYRNDRIVLLFLQLLESIGKYIKSQKADAHPDAIKLLNSVYSGLEIVSMAEGMTEAEKKKILALEVARFRELKTKIDQKQGASKSTPPASDAGVIAIDSGNARLDAALQQGLTGLRDELIRVIHAEFQALRAELTSRSDSEDA